MFTPYMAIATFSYFCMVMGILNRKKNRLAHIRWMSLAMLIDLSIVGILEYQRDAIQTTIDMKLGFVQQIHIAVSLMAVLFYFPTIYFGWMLYWGKRTLRLKTHKWLGILVFLLRTIGFVTMFKMGSG
ncbi:MAG: hypothetical protein J0L93_02285 [Deltaproteobacteria bacterium]|nr:hypothetical protein [Deltaproteobacteria bacterium]